MTSFKPSDGKPQLVGLAGGGQGTVPEDVCPTCGNLKRLRNARPFPVVIQALFGISFLAFLWYQGTSDSNTRVLWGWSILQILLGVFLVKARYAAAKKVFICLRCEPPIR